jgi:hypothetical protein
MNPNVIFYVLLTLMLGTFAAGVASLPNTSATASVEQRDSPAQRYHFTMPASMTDSQAPAWTFHK